MPEKAVSLECPAIATGIVGESLPDAVDTQGGVLYTKGMVLKIIKAAPKQVFLFTHA